MGLFFPIPFLQKVERIQPRQFAEASMAIEELHPFSYPFFGDSQHAAVQDNRSEIAERPPQLGSSQKPSLQVPFNAINLLKRRRIRVINCRRARKIR
jgi:hypothetical protein